jgi:chemotaxis protein CheD
MTERERRAGGVGMDGQLVHPGEIALVTDGKMLISIVSVGVAVCLWEHGGTLAALAHFVEPRIQIPHQATSRFGNVALIKTIQLIREYGPMGQVEAQIFGGAHQPGASAHGIENVEMARKVLQARGIPIVSEDIGGSKGRKLMFDTKTGHVAVIRVHHLRQEDWNP